MQEIWKNINGFENMYQISNKGHVKSLERPYLCRGAVRTTKEKILKPLNNRGKYQYVEFHKNNKIFRLLIHKIVAEAFVPNPHNYPVVSFLDGDKLNYIPTNLEWTTLSESHKRAFKLKLRKPVDPNPMKDKYGADHHNAKRIKQYTVDGKFIKLWGSIVDAKRCLNISGITHVLSKRSSHAGGFWWEYADQ